jgi:hypothetical protein
VSISGIYLDWEAKFQEYKSLLWITKKAGTEIQLVYKQDLYSILKEQREGELPPLPPCLVAIW